MVFKNCDELAKFLGVSIRPNTNEKQRLLNKVKRYFVIEYLQPKDLRSERSYAFRIVEKKYDEHVKIEIKVKELELLEQILEQQED